MSSRRFYWNERCVPADSLVDVEGVEGRADELEALVEREGLPAARVADVDAELDVSETDVGICRQLGPM
jgi:hypothetical protein